MRDARRETQEQRKGVQKDNDWMIWIRNTRIAALVGSGSTTPIGSPDMSLISGRYLTEYKVTSDSDSDVAIPAIPAIPDGT